MNKLKLGVIGAGSIFRNAHVNAWHAHPDVEIHAVCDVIKEKADAVAAQYDIPHVYTDYLELINNEEIDMIDICTGNIYHSEIAIAALEAGKHVFCEKPDAINVEEAEKMLAASEKSGKVLMTMRNNRFRAHAQFLKKYITAGHMGEIYTGRCGWIRRRGIPGKGGWFTNKALSGGGPLIDLGVHFIDLAIWLMGNPKPVSVFGATYRKFADSTISDSKHSQFGERNENGIFDVEDLATGFIRFENGETLQIEFSWASNIEHEMNFLELRGTQAGFSMKNDELKLFTELEGALCDIYPRIPIEKGDQGHSKHIDHFVDCIANGTEPIILPEHGVDMIKILMALYESAETGELVKL
ncbi:Gfo/Idh/MocA family protein [Paenibacillus campinasensis]|uniref:Oxidoreductase n=1 Tax=Paenibacillus campinasensis TaxID=66347 RepID=A0A268EPY3_9BACL|nr:Gfo/Idh/MocA family oxidoreductase [Paenibacillus campinasensis]PAD75156.1 oxidoreductase [Paenibacillus campinasensis]